MVGQLCKPSPTTLPYTHLHTSLPIHLNSNCLHTFLLLFLCVYPTPHTNLLLYMHMSAHHFSAHLPCTPSCLLGQHTYGLAFPVLDPTGRWPPILLFSYQPVPPTHLLATSPAFTYCIWDSSSPLAVLFCHCLPSDSVVNTSLVHLALWTHGFWTLHTHNHTSLSYTFSTPHHRLHTFPTWIICIIFCTTPHTTAPLSPHIHTFMHAFYPDLPTLYGTHMLTSVPSSLTRWVAFGPHCNMCAPHLHICLSVDNILYHMQLCVFYIPPPPIHPLYLGCWLHTVYCLLAPAHTHPTVYYTFHLFSHTHLPPTVRSPLLLYTPHTHCLAPHTHLLLVYYLPVSPLVLWILLCVQPQVPSVYFFLWVLLLMPPYTLSFSTLPPTHKPCILIPSLPTRSHMDLGMAVPCTPHMHTFYMQFCVIAHIICHLPWTCLSHSHGPTTCPTSIHCTHASGFHQMHTLPPPSAPYLTHLLHLYWVGYTHTWFLCLLYTPTFIIPILPTHLHRTMQLHTCLLPHTWTLCLLPSHMAFTASPYSSTPLLPTHYTHTTFTPSSYMCNKQPCIVPPSCITPSQVLGYLPCTSYTMSPTWHTLPTHTHSLSPYMLYLWLLHMYLLGSCFTHCSHPAFLVFPCILCVFCPPSHSMVSWTCP